MSQKLYIYLSFTDLQVGIYLLHMLIHYTLSSSGVFIGCDNIKPLFLNLQASYCIGMGTFIAISYLRNIAIRKPFHIVKNRTVYIWLVLWTLYTTASTLFTAFVMYFKSATIHYRVAYAFGIGSLILVQISLVTVLNIWSTKVLSKQSKTLKITSDIEIRKGIKRNEKAVGILNLIVIVYVISILPSCVYLFVTGIAIQTSHKLMTEFSASLFSYANMLCIFQPGLNALVYILKDKAIKRFYNRVFCPRKT